jgi:AraC-like DNA-binding protein
MFSFKYSIPLSEPSSRMDLKLYYCGTEECECGHSWGPAVKDHYKIHYIHSGKGIFKLGDKSYELKSGQCFLICPNALAYYQADEQDPWSYYWIAFNGINAQSYLRRANLTLDNPVISCNCDALILQCFSQMFEGSKFPNSGDMRLLSSLYLFLGIMMDQAENNKALTKQSNNDNSYINKAIEWLEVNYSSTVTISEIAEYIGLNRKYFSRIFKREIGMSPQNFLINFRLNKACELMMNNQLSIGEISRSVGYVDQLLFSKIFKKFKGVSPNNYRKNI